MPQFFFRPLKYDVNHFKTVLHFGKGSSWSHQSIQLLAVRFLLLMSGLHLVVLPPYCSSLSLLQTVETFTAALWRWSVMSPTDVLEFLHSSHNTYVINCCFFSLGQPVLCLLLSTPMVQDITICCKSYPQCLCNGSDRYPLFSKLHNGLLFFQKQKINQHEDQKHKCSFHRQTKTKKIPRVDRTDYCLTNQSTRTHLGNKKNLSVTFQYFCSPKNWVV